MLRYRGYLIRYNMYAELYWIEKDRQLIARAKDIDDAKRQIDELLGPTPAAAGISDL